MERGFALKEETIVYVTERNPFAAAEVAPDIAWKIINKKGRYGKWELLRSRSQS